MLSSLMYAYAPTAAWVRPEALNKNICSSDVSTLNAPEEPPVLSTVEIATPQATAVAFASRERVARVVGR